LKIFFSYSTGKMLTKYYFCDFFSSASIFLKNSENSGRSKMSNFVTVADGHGVGQKMWKNSTNVFSKSIFDSHMFRLKIFFQCTKLAWNAPYICINLICFLIFLNITLPLKKSSNVRSFKLQSMSNFVRIVWQIRLCSVATFYHRYCVKPIITVIF